MGDDDPLFPATKIGLGDSGGFRPDDLRRDGWSSAGPIRDIFRNAFEAAGLPHFNPHSFRNTLVQLGEQRCATPEQFKAWSQNLGHERVMTTLTSYGNIAPHRQGALMPGMATAQPAGSHASDGSVDDAISDLAAVLARMKATANLASGIRAG